MPGGIRALFANLAPIKVAGLESFGSAFTKELANASTAQVCTGYVAAESVAELQALLEKFNQVNRFDLIVGMARFDGLTVEQQKSLLSLDDFLVANGKGRVRISIALPIHAKLARFDGVNKTAIIGSSNLGSLTRATRQYEVDVLVENQDSLMNQFDEFLVKSTAGSLPITESLHLVKIVESGPHPLVNVAGVSQHKIDIMEVRLSTISFELPIKTQGKSNINAFFGKGRISYAGRTLPRPWYEVELIIPKAITGNEEYPKGEARSIFWVNTDDGFRFQCKTSGDYSKNFRSAGDLETLGRWLKGRLERAGVLVPGEKVTEAVLLEYGRDTLTFTKLLDGNEWYLDFGV